MFVTLLEIAILKSQLPINVYETTPERVKLFGDGGIAIIDQWICSHAKYFIGTKESTFSFRIYEERELMGFKSKMTYNQLCNNHKSNCERPSRWKVVY